MNASQLLPRVVHREYFGVSGVDPASEPERFGFLRSIGHDVFSFLCSHDGDLIRNVHSEHLQELKMTPEEAIAQSIANLRVLAFDGATIAQQITKTKGGNDWAVWVGNEFTSACLLLPELHAWSSKHLRAASFLVSVPSSQLLFILPSAAKNVIPAFNKYIAGVVQGSNNLISPDWFFLDTDGLFPWHGGEGREMHTFMPA